MKKVTAKYKSGFKLEDVETHDGYYTQIPIHGENFDVFVFKTGKVWKAVDFETGVSYGSTEKTRKGALKQARENAERGTKDVKEVKELIKGYDKINTLEKD